MITTYAHQQVIRFCTLVFGSAGQAVRLIFGLLLMILFSVAVLAQTPNHPPVKPSAPTKQVDEHRHYPVASQNTVAYIE